VELQLQDNGKKVSVVFSADLGQPNKPIVRDPETMEQTDYLFIESTYGDRLHARNGEPESQLEEISAKPSAAEATSSSGLRGGADPGRRLLPASDYGRTRVGHAGVCRQPAGLGATEIYRRHREAFDEEAWKLVGEPGGIFDFANLHYTASATSPGL